MLHLSFDQERLWYLQKLLPESSFYHIPFSIELRGYVCVDSLSYALREVINRHSILRTNIVEQQGQAFQVIKAPLSSFKLERVDLTSLKVEAQAEQLEELLRLNAQKPFNLASDSLLRVLLVALSEERHVLAVTFHHLIADGWSLAIFCRELSAFYNHAVAGDAVNLTPLAIQFSDFAHWQRQSPVSHLEYWLKHLENPPALSTFPTNYRRPAELSYRGRTLSFTLPDDLLQQLKAFSEAQEVTLFMTLLSAFMVLLQRYSQQEDLIIGLPVANRSHPDVEPLIGFFTNTLAFRLQGLESNLRFLEVLQLTKATVLESFEHQEAPFEQVVDHLQVPRMLNANPLFQVMFSYQEQLEYDLKMKGVKASFNPYEFYHSKFDITLFCEINKGKALIKIEYATDLYEEETVERLGAHYQQLLTEIMAAPQGAIGAFELLTSSERQKILYDWNNTSAPYPSDVCLHELFEAQVERTPDAIAVRFEDESLSYRELNERSNRLAHALRAEGVGPEVLVAIALDRSFEMIISVLGILKAGGAYVPLDPSFPEERLKFMVEDCQVEYLITSLKYVQKFANLIGKIFRSEEFGELLSLPSQNPSILTKPNNTIYVLYTSGSTGKPKGSPNLHSSLVNRIVWMKEHCSIINTDRVLQKTPITFDVAGWEFFLPLISGAQLILMPPEDHKDPQKIYEIILAQKITTLHFIPSMLEAFLKIYDVSNNSLPLRTICTSGEALQNKTAENFFKILSSVKLLNLYGPTEAAIDVTYADYHSHYSAYEFSIIGKPIANTQIYILDDNKKPVPINIKGELYIGGIGLSPGYINNLELNKEKFITIPVCLHSKQEQVLFKTGDIAKFMPNGNIQFIGRADNQVKILGVRIELSEIEAFISEHPSVEQVIVRYSSASQEPSLLKAYIRLNAVSLSEREVRKELELYLKKHLPPHMLPNQYHFLDNFPLLPNGKVNLKALDGIDLKEEREPHERTVPKTNIEKDIAAIWSELLRREEIFLEDNFFALGGHSLLAVQSLARINEKYCAQFSLRNFFEYPNLGEFCQYAESLSALHNKTLPILDRSRPGPLSPHQRGLWLLNQMNPLSSAYNVSGIFHIEGDIDIRALEMALELLIRHHESLRTKFILESGEPTQIIRQSTDTVISVYHLEDITPIEQNETIQFHCQQEASVPFNLQEDLLIRGRLLILSPNTSKLIITVHHIVCDEWSVDIICRDLSVLYNSIIENDTPQLLPALPFQFADFALWKNKVLTEDRLNQQLSFWQDHLCKIASPLNLPLDYPRAAREAYVAGYYSQSFPMPGFKKLMRELQTSFFQAMLTAAEILFYLYSSQKKFAIGIPTTNRDFPGAEKLVGYLVSIVALPAAIEPGDSFIQLLKNTKETLLNSYENNDVSLDMIVKNLNLQKTTLYNPIFQIMFAQKEAKKPEIRFGNTVATPTINISHAQFDMGISVYEKDNDEIEVSLEYSADLYKETTIDSLVKNYQFILEQIVQNPNQLIRNFTLLNLESRMVKQLDIYRGPLSPYPSDVCLHELFEAQVERTPDAIAVRFEDENLSYRELNERSNRLAHALRAEGVGPEVLVAIALDRSFEMIISVLGILKAGGAYVPLDPSFPEERLKFMVEDTQAPIVLSFDRSLLGSAYKGKIIDPREVIAQESLSSSNLRSDVKPHHLAYVIYTSGSTGKPKGVMIEHEGVVCLMQGLQDRYPLGLGETVLLQSSFNFDASVEEIFWPILFGGTMVIAPPKIHQDLKKLALFIEVENIYNVRFVPSLLDAFFQQSEVSRCASLRRIFSGGEALSPKTKELILQTFPLVELYNDYGPTEITVRATTYKCNASRNESLIPIGRPIPNKTVYLLDETLDMVGIGVVGELYIGGVGLARGYINRPELTAERFIDNPYATEEDRQAGRNLKLYRTGDLGRYLPDGTIEFLGRTDDQVKIRGYRIELGEIESALLQEKGAKQVLVMAVEQDQQKSLVAYVVPEGELSKETLGRDLRVALEGVLPEYMVPQAFVFLESFPLSVNGKIDRSALPRPDRSDLTNTSFEVPETETERVLAEIWKDLLHLEAVGRYDNFFQIGGHSLLAVQMIISAKKYNLQIAPGDIFEYPTIQSLSAFIDNSTKQEGNKNEAA
ncbi:hypothetical protein IM40_02410 [Candidatus Paracaedimonas acanthamoebae]|nr:hypothetical protein IM40_02410 [Candidatus Paracaedimonas acanthamoebae]